jgi:lipopolysaccharide export system protein LptA
MEQTAANGARQTTSGDRIEAHFVTTATSEKAGDKARPQSANEMGAVQIETATVDGHVALTNTSQARPGAPSESSLMATAGHAVYQGPGEWLHLTINPRMENDTMQISADRIDVSQASGDALAHGNVKATWVQDAPQTLSSSKGKAAPQGVGNGADGPAHAIAAEAVFNRATGEATFRGQARLWQQANSISAPVIVLDHTRQTLIAHADTATEPVKTVLVSTEATGKKDKNSTPSVIRMKGGDFRYSDAERKATMRAGAVGSVTAETGTATSVSSQVDLVLLPAGNHAGKDGASAQVDRMIAHGHVVLTSAGRRGTGEQLVYTGATGEYLLTGTGSVPPRMSDPQRGTVTGEALIFHSGDQSIVVEGGAGKTTTETTAPR